MASRTGGGVGTNQHAIKGRSKTTDPAGKTRAGALTDSTPALPNATVWFHKVDPTDTNNLVAAGVTPVDHADRHDGEPVIIYELPGGDRLEAQITDYSDWSEVTMHPVGAQRHTDNYTDDGISVEDMIDKYDLDADEDLLEEQIRELAYTVRAHEDAIANAAIRAARNTPPAPADVAPAADASPAEYAYAVYPTAVDALRNEGFFPVGFAERHEDEPVLIFELPDGSRYEALLDNMGDWNELSFVPAGGSRGPTAPRYNLGALVGNHDMDTDTDVVDDNVRELAYAIRDHETRVAADANRR